MLRSWPKLLVKFNFSKVFTKFGYYASTSFDGNHYSRVVTKKVDEFLAREFSAPVNDGGVGSGGD